MVALRLRTAALTACLALVLTGCGDDDAGASSPDLVQGRLGELSGSEFNLLVPTGQVTFQLSDPADVVTATQAADGHEHEAPEGSDWVGVTWQFLPGAGFDPFHRTLMDDPSQRTELVLVDGGTTFELGDASQSTTTPADVPTSGIVYVPVTEGAGVRLEAAFDGVTTAVDTTTGEVTGGAGSALADLEKPPLVRECPPLTAGRGRADTSCTYVMTSVPYLSGHGWAEEGWTVAQVETRTATFEVGRSTYSVQDTTDASTLGGDVESTVVAQRLDSLVTRTAVEGAANRLDISRTLSGVRTAGPGPDDAMLELTGAVDLG